MGRLDCSNSQQEEAPESLMRSHRTIWTITTAILLLALIAFVLREARHARERKAMTNTAIEVRDTVTRKMVALLKKDPRVRRSPTQRMVEAASSYATHPTLASSETFYALGLRKFYGESDFEGAEVAYLEAVAMRPDWSWPRNGLGILWFSTGQEERGLDSFQEALRLEPSWSRPHSDMAILYRHTGRMDEAIREVEAALNMEPLDPFNHYNYGVILDELSRHAEARAKYEKTLELSPGLPQAMYNLACGYAREADLETALPYLIESIRIDDAFREEARNDPDFDRVRDRPAFISVMNSPNR